MELTDTHCYILKEIRIYYIAQGTIGLGNGLPGGFHGQRGLTDYSPWGRKESDMTERLSTHTGNYIQYFVITYDGKASEKMCITESLCYVPETNTIL